MSENSATESTPKRARLNEIEFCREFRNKHGLIFSEGSFFSPEGQITDEEELRKEIYLALEGKAETGISRTVDGLMNVLRMESKEELSVSPTRIQLANGIYDLDKGFIERKEICRARLPVAWNPVAPEPVRWKRFLEELLEPDDILTLQEYMGYCLIPTTVAQKMLMIIGHGGEGKSRIGVVMHGLFGATAVNGSLNKVENNRFARADLEHKLVMVDDDLNMEALNQTSYLKSIITAETPMDLERKNVQSYQGKLYVRFLAFGNGSLRALHDRSHGFFRRQIILMAKERPFERVDDPNLGTKLLAELEGILLWALEGLERLHRNDYRFTISGWAWMNLRESMVQGNNVVDFMESEGYFLRSPDAQTSTRALYQVYKDWCEDNMLEPLGPRSFSDYLCQNLKHYGLERSNHIPIGNGRQVRGFKGIRLLPRM